MIGGSLTEPYTSGTALQDACVCLHCMSRLHLKQEEGLLLDCSVSAKENSDQSRPR